MLEPKKKIHLHVEIEPTNICNTECLHCPHDAISRPYGKMDWDTYQTVVDQVLNHTPNHNFEFAGMGEPLLNPLIYRFIDYLRGKSPTSVTSNASALTPANTEKLIQAGLNHLTISFNGEDKTIYELMMGGLNFERAEKNLRNAILMAQGTQMVVGANVSVTRQTQERLADIRKYLNDAGVTDIYFSKCHNRGGFLKGDLVCTTPAPPSESYRCDIFKNTLFVAWTGEILSCCHDLSGATSLGDLHSLKLNSVLENKERITQSGVRFDICRNCNDLYRFMDDQPVGSKDIGDWIYNLYAGLNLESHPERSSLSEWIYSVYAQEGQQKRFFSNLTYQIDDKDQQIRNLVIINTQEIEGLKAQLGEIYSSRSWKLIQRFQRFRLSIIPKGSKREGWFRAFLSLFT